MELKNKIASGILWSIALGLVCMYGLVIYPGREWLIFTIFVASLFFSGIIFIKRNPIIVFLVMIFMAISMIYVIITASLDSGPISLANIGLLIFDFSFLYCTATIEEDT